MALLRTAFLLTGDLHAAEDLLQDTLARMYVRWSRISTSPEAYARRALVNASVSRWRSRGRRPEVPLSPAHDQAQGDHSGAVTVRTVVAAALRQQARQQRAVVVLRYFDDLSEVETAALLGCSVGSVKAHASRGLARLRAALGPGFVTGADPPPAPAGRAGTASRPGTTQGPAATMPVAPVPMAEQTGSTR